MSRYARLATIYTFTSLIVVVTEAITGKTTPASLTHHYQSESTVLNHSRLNNTDNYYNGTFRRSESGIEMLNLTDYEKYNGTYGERHNFSSFDNLNVTTDDENEDEQEDKFIETKEQGIISEHIDFVLLRLKHISMKASSNITELLEIQQKEFEENLSYKYGWERAESSFNSYKRDELYNISSPDSIVRQVPEEYHIAIIAYTGSMYSSFNKATREVCSGKDIDGYKWMSYFKLLQLAIESLGTQEEKWRDNQRFLYRGASPEYVLKEGQVIAFQHFVSTSVALRVAENFAEKSLFEFQGLYNGTAMAVWDHSYFVTEKEYLFSPLQTFRVDSIHVGKHYTRYVLVKNERPVVISNLHTTISQIRGTVSMSRNSFRAHSKGTLLVHSVLLLSFLTLCHFMGCTLIKYNSQ
ncbi:unnamed protein product [Orchesella dallaii]|uniref:NAD(P)(+)--arginine ADP-ribosyltransferase n=1 Tax=Orchesella dallaii TaxID=48710 RepID=A0ABP1PJV7_9HEXA